MARMNSNAPAPTVCTVSLRISFGIWMKSASEPCRYKRANFSAQPKNLESLQEPERRGQSEAIASKQLGPLLYQANRGETNHTRNPKPDAHQDEHAGDECQL